MLYMGSILALSVFASQIHLSQRERPWQRDEVCVDCQGLSLWESCQSRQALTERARTLRDQREQTEGVIFEGAGKAVGFD